MEGVLGKEEKKTEEEVIIELDKGMKEIKINEDLFKEDENLDELDDIADDKEDDKKEDEKE